MNRRFLAICIALFAVSLVYAQPSSTYYKKVDGLKKVELKLALKSIISDHTKLTYSSTLPQAYESVYYVDGNEEYVYDMFSYDSFKFSSSAWNKEHVIPNSWWGKEDNNAYSDIFSVIPSEKTANNRKSNYPIGTVGTEKWGNGCIKVGSPVDGQGGSYTYVFEPADEFKGDFARIYFYVATCYSDINWNSGNVVSEINKEDWPTLNEWLYTLLLEWHNADPVCDKEKQINNSAEDVQGNRNPFIDYPVLADYIWGDSTNVAFDLASAELYKHIAVAGGDTIDPIDPDTIEPVNPDTIEPVNPDTIEPVIIGDILFADYFDSVTSGNSTYTDGSSDAWSGDSLFISCTSAFQAGGAVKLGSGKKVGVITSGTIDYEGGDVVVEIGVKGWTSIEGALIVTLGGQSQTAEYTHTLSDGFERITLTFKDVQENPVIEIQTSEKRCFIDYVVVCSASEPEYEYAAEDVNKDKVVDTQDVLKIYEYMQKATDGDDATRAAENVNGDSAVDTQDVLKVYEYMKGK